MRPPMKKINYKVGDNVEVCNKEEGSGFIGSHFEANVVSCLDNGRYVIRYKNLLKDDKSGPLIETLLPKDFRPSPPRVRKISKFQFNQKVDVFDNDGWWVGIIKSEKILVGKSYYYTVYFDYTDQSIDYSCDKIRVHHELMFNGKWRMESQSSS